MANILGVNFGTTCDHLVRRNVTLYLDDTLQPPFSTVDQEFWCRVDSDINLSDPQFVLFVNQEAFSSIARVALPDEHFVIFTSVGGFGLGGFGEGGYGMGGFNTGVNLASLDQYPADETELQYQTTARHCPKCILKDDDGRIVRNNLTTAG